jgi:hypothetical protein
MCEVTQMNAETIVTIHFRDGSTKRYPWVGLHVDKRGSLLVLTIDGRSDSYANVTIIDVSLANTADRETEMVA